MRHSIERKILVPFLIIVLLPSLVTGAVSLWSSYQSEKELKVTTVEEKLDSVHRYATLLRNRVDEGEIAEQDARSMMRELIQDTEGLYAQNDVGVIYKNDRMLLPNQVASLLSEEAGFLEERLVLSEALPEWGWTLYHPVELSFYSGSLLNIQKYTLLVAIFTGVIAVQFTILFSHHLSKPIKDLASFCKRIAKGEAKAELRIGSRRKDEIGVLATSLQEMVHNLDEQKQQIDRIKQQNERILNSVHVGILLIRKHTEPLSNVAAEEMLKRDQTLQRKLEALIERRSRHRTEEIMMTHVDHEKVYYAVSYQRMGADSDLAIMTFEDITQRRKLEQRVERMSRLASLGEMASGIAHEIRNPLAGIKSTTELLLRRLKLSEQEVKLTENMLIDIERVNKTITTTLDFSRPVESKPVNVKVDESIQSVLLLLRTMAKEKQVTFKHCVHQFDVWVDRDQLRQILLNVVMNGLNAMPDGGELTMNSRATDHDVILTISDTGIGMDEDTVERIFDPFFTTRAEGTGLGLSIVHQLVVQNKGDIEVVSTSGRGTTFEISFQRAEGGSSYGGESRNH
ncbi:HAMP domain-containing protein [Halobacillus litoralis]|uniref:sensor histidine kinase n=1 Tax=Halobacillus litoralis TaxID=45668 RepID=UPI001CD5F886|nr:ATP-binding protein [Halobacillus litoralis]MCA0970483.1 HAMP domain-containing protein [Halobacillus litoralis]